VFHGEEKTHAHAMKGVSYWLPLAILLVLSTGVGALIQQPLADVLPAMPSATAGEQGRLELELVSGGIAILGIVLAAFLFLGERRFVTALGELAPARAISKLWYNAWGFDWLYDRVFVKPFMFLVDVLRHDPADQGIGLLPRLTRLGNRLLVPTENGQIRWYAASFAVAALIILSLLVLV